MYRDLPGGELLEAGLRDLSQGIKSIPALVLMIGGARLRRHGIAIPVACPSDSTAEESLYDALFTEHGADAYRIYSALVDQLVSLENALPIIKHT